MKLTVILAVAVIFVAAATYFLLPTATADQPIYLQNKNYLFQTEIYNMYRTTHANVVMLGDSHTYNVNWNELLGRMDIINRGIRGDITAGFLQRLEQITRLHPHMCFIMGGINDLYTKYSPADIARNTSQIVTTLRNADIEPIVQSVMFVDSTYADATAINQQVSELNALLEKYSLDSGVTYVDVNALVRQGSFLGSDLTTDGLHLNARAYGIWAQEVEKILRKKGL